MYDPHEEPFLDLLKTKRVNHGQKKTKLYRIWQNMKSRCYYPSVERYKNYGGRGIKVCHEWQEAFLTFKEWADNNGYVDGLTIERIDNNGNYEPSNCTWIPHAEQQNNTTNSIVNRYDIEVLSDAVEFYVENAVTVNDVAKLLDCSFQSMKGLIDNADVYKGQRRRTYVCR